MRRAKDRGGLDAESGCCWRAGRAGEDAQGSGKRAGQKAGTGERMQRARREDEGAKCRLVEARRRAKMQGRGAGLRCRAEVQGRGCRTEGARSRGIR